MYNAMLDVMWDLNFVHYSDKRRLTATSLATSSA